jgi:hypothetical protein
MSSLPFDTQELFITLNRTQISKLSPETISSLSDNQISWLTKLQISWLNKNQVAALRVHVLSIEQLKDMLTQIAFFSTLNNFTKEKIQAFTLNQVKLISPSALANTEHYVHTLFTGSQLDAMTVLQFKEIKLNLLSIEQLSLVNRNLSVLDTLNSLREDQIKSLTPKQMKYISTKCLSNSNITLLTSEQLNSLSNQQFIALKITDLTLDQFKSLGRVLASLPSLTLLSKEQVESLSKEQLIFISVKVLEASITVLPLLTKTQINSLSLAQLSAVIRLNQSSFSLLDKIDSKLVPLLSIKDLSVDGFNLLQQLDKFNCYVDKYAYIQKITYVRYLTDKQISELTPDHYKVLNVSVLSFRQVPLINITKLTKEQLGCFSNDNRGAMSESQMNYYMDNFWNTNNDIPDETSTIDSQTVVLNDQQ